MAREAAVRRLNREYVKAAQEGDVDWYRVHLADEFVGIESDGTMLDKAAFLRNIARSDRLAEYRLEDVNVRFYDDVAVVRATGGWQAKLGTIGAGRFVAIYALTGNEWKAVSAQTTEGAPAS